MLTKLQAIVIVSFSFFLEVSKPMKQFGCREIKLLSVFHTKNIGEKIWGTENTLYSASVTIVHGVTKSQLGVDQWTWMHPRRAYYYNVWRTNMYVSFIVGKCSLVRFEVQYSHKESLVYSSDFFHVSSHRNILRETHVAHFERTCTRCEIWGV